LFKAESQEPLVYFGKMVVVLTIMVFPIVIFYTYEVLLTTLEKYKLHFVNFGVNKVTIY
jgi:hypothetical protein